jgi:hypothetical protein
MFCLTVIHRYLVFRGAGLDAGQELSYLGQEPAVLALNLQTDDKVICLHSNPYDSEVISAFIICSTALIRFDIIFLPSGFM